jgi:Tol biopolymer transport system component
VKKPLVLLWGIFFSILALSILFPSDPNKPNILDIMNKEEKKQVVHEDKDLGYRIEGLVRVDTSGKALAWSLDEKNIYYSKKVQGKSGLEELWITDVKGQKQKIESSIEFYNIRDARISPNGRYLSFISGNLDDKNKLYIYDTTNNNIKDITPLKAEDTGVTSYDWDEQSLNIIMTADIVNPGIVIYSVDSGHMRKLDMNLNACRNVGFLRGNKIIFSDQDEEGLKSKIYTANSSGKNVKILLDGRDFIVSPNKNKIAILSDENLQEGLWVYNLDRNKKINITLNPTYNVYWLPRNPELIFSTEEDSLNRKPFRKDLYVSDDSGKIDNVSDAIYTIFVPSKTGKKIAITSPDYAETTEDKVGVFWGELSK